MTATERAAWLESRRNGIGSSDVAKVLGLSPWGNALDVYLAKTKPAKEHAMTGPQEWGHRLEPAIAGAIIDATGWTLSKPPTLRHPEHDWLIASPDRSNEAGELIEIKTSARGDGWGESETDAIPEQYWIQVQHQLAVAVVPVCHVFALIGGNDFRRYRVERDEQYLPTVFDALRDFWACVETRTPPEPEWSAPNVLASVNRLYQSQPGKVVELENPVLLMADEYQAMGAEITEKTKQRDELKARIIHALSDAETGLLPDGRKITRKLVERKGYTVEPTSYHDFRIAKPSTRKVGV